MKRLLICLSVLAVLVGACGGDDDKTSSTGSKPAGTSATKGLKGGLLTAAELPDGFKRTKAEESDATAKTDAEDDSEPCPQLEQVSKDFPGDRKAEAEFERSGSATAGVFIGEQIRRFADDAEADDAFTAYETAFPNCKSFTEEDAESKITGSFEKTSFAKAGDDTYATVFTFTQTATSGQSVTFEGHFVALREGRYIIRLLSLGFGDKITKAEVEAVAKKAVAKL